MHLDVLALGLLGLLTGGFFWRVLTEGGVMMPEGGGDIASFYYPTYLYAASEIKQGALPLWNPHLFAGMPLAADVQVGLFYPINWVLYLLVQVDYGSLEWLLIFHYWLAAALMYVFLRDLRIGRAGALAGGVAFAFCGFMTAHLGHLPMVPVAAWLPLTLLCLRRAYYAQGSGGWAWGVGAGASMTMSLLAGHAQIFSYSMMAAGVLWLFLLFDRKPLTWRGGLDWVGKGAMSLVVVLGLGAIQLLPSIQLSGQSVRDSISYEEAGAFAAQPITLINLLLPRVYGGDPSSYMPGEWQNTENWGYCGVVTLALAAAGLVLRRGRMVAFFLALTVFALLIMVGDLSIVGGWIYGFLPGFSSLRSSGRALFLLGFALAGLSAYGLDGLLIHLRSPEAHKRRPVMWWLVGLSVAVGVAALFVMPLFYSQTLQLSGAQYGRLPQAINDLGMLILWIGGLAGLGWAAWRGRIGTGMLSAGVVGLLVLDIFSPNSQFNPTTDNLLAGYQHFAARSTAYKVTRDPATGVPFRLDSEADAQDVWQPATSLLMSEDPETKMYDTGGAFNPLKLRRYDYLWMVAKGNFDSPLYDLVGAKVRVVSASTVLTNSLKWKLLDDYEGFKLYENANAVPRLFMVHDAVVEPDGFSTVERIRNFDVDPRHTVLLESGAGVVRSALPGTAEVGGSPTERVEAKRDLPQEIVIEVAADAAGWVVLTDAWYPGWEATVDGRSVPVEVAYHAFRAVQVEAGPHTIVMRFRPDVWAWASLVSFLSLLATGVGLVILLVVPRRGR